MNFLSRDSDLRELIFMAIIAVIFFTLRWTLTWIGGYSELAYTILIFGILVLGFDIFVGLTGYLSFGHAAFWGIGAYACALSLANVSNNIFIAMVIAVLIVTVVALLMGLISLRRQGIYFSILTLAFAEMFYFLALAPLSRWTNGDDGYTGAETVHPHLFGIDMLHGINLYTFVVIIAVLAVFLARLIKRSPYGLMLRAINSNEVRMTYTGLNVYFYKVMAFVISGMFGGVAGALFAVHERYVPVSSLHWPVSGEVVIMAVIGGFGTLIGPMIGTGIVLYLENVLSAITGQWGIILGAIFMSFVIFLRGGIMDLPRGVRKLLETLQAKPRTWFVVIAFVALWIALVLQFVFPEAGVSFQNDVVSTDISLGAIIAFVVAIVTIIANAFMDSRKS